MLTLDLKQLPARLEESRLDELATKLREGIISPEEKAELTGGFIKLASYIARTLGGSNYSRVEDYFSCGLFGIAYAIHHAHERLRDQNIAAWIVYNIKAHIQRFRRTDHAVAVPTSTYVKAKKEGRKLPIAPSVQPLGSAEPYREYNSVFELRDVLDLCARDDYDRQIIRLRYQGYTDVEIAQKIGVSKSLVNNRRSSLESRFDEMIRENADIPSV